MQWCISAKYMLGQFVACMMIYSNVLHWQSKHLPKGPASVVIDSSTYMLTISSPDIDNVCSNEPLQHHLQVTCTSVLTTVCSIQE